MRATPSKWLVSEMDRSSTADVFFKWAVGGQFPSPESAALAGVDPNKFQL